MKTNLKLKSIVCGLIAAGIGLSASAPASHANTIRPCYEEWGYINIGNQTYRKSLGFTFDDNDRGFHWGHDKDPSRCEEARIAYLGKVL